MYKRGFCLAVLGVDGRASGCIKKYALECEEFIIGIPSKTVHARIIDNKHFYYNPDDIIAFWESFDWVSKVVELDSNQLMLQDCYKIIEFDFFLFGCEPGFYFAKDIAFCKTKGIVFEVARELSDEEYNETEYDALEVALSNILPGQKIVMYSNDEVFPERYRLKYGNRYPLYKIYRSDDRLWNDNAWKSPISPIEELIESKRQDVLVILGDDVLSDRYTDTIKRRFDYRLFSTMNLIATMNEMAIVLYEENQYIDFSQNCLRNLLREFDRICSKYMIKYYAVYGTLIGAMREKGFIPWDDDLDIAMPREDYERFCEIVKSEWERKSDYVNVPYQNVKPFFYDCMSRIYYAKEKITYKTEVIEGGVEIETKNRQLPDELSNRFWIDIYILDNASDSRWIFSIKTNMMKLLYVMLMGHRKNIDYSEYKELKKIHVLFLAFISRIGRKIPIGLLYKAYDGLCKLCNKYESKDYHTGSGIIASVDRRFSKELLGDGTRVTFEDFTICIPSNANILLKSVSGTRFYNHRSTLKRRKPKHYFRNDVFFT